VQIQVSLANKPTNAPLIIAHPPLLAPAAAAFFCAPV
jgi:hypothetical protein